MTSNSQLTIAIAQIAPVWLSRDQTLAKVTDWVERAAARDCDLVVFGEALVPGYPFWLERTDGARFDSSLQKSMFAHYAQEAVTLDEGHLEPVCEAARRSGLSVFLGIVELASDRGGHSLYCSLVFIGSTGKIESVHRKLMPTYEERLVWACGDGNGLRTHRLGAFTVGGLNCWENWLPLVRASLYAQGEDLHVAVWPGNPQNTEDITRFIARESRSFVVSAAGLLRKSDIPTDLPHFQLISEKADEIMAAGGSCVAGPTGDWILPPADCSEDLLVCTIDHRQVMEERQNLDVSGHYSRPDVTQLEVDRRRQGIVKFIDDN